uniref:Uncharacterized protein n=1 Tax=Glossina austeni TaxID=7395 RepID=A0A1A9VC87_GLOAU
MAMRRNNTLSNNFPKAVYRWPDRFKLGNEYSRTTLSKNFSKATTVASPLNDLCGKGAVGKPVGGLQLGGGGAGAPAGQAFGGNILGGGGIPTGGGSGGTNAVCGGGTGGGGGSIFDAAAAAFGGGGGGGAIKGGGIICPGITGIILGTGASAKISIVFTQEFHKSIALMHLRYAIFWHVHIN